MSKRLSIDDLFKGRHFDGEIIVLCVRWCLRHKLSYRDLVEMMAERGLSLAPSTILRWVQHYAPEFQKRWNRFARPVGGSPAHFRDNRAGNLERGARRMSFAAE